MENRIKELRRECHMTQVRLSIELEVSQETISAYESGKYYPSFPSLVRLKEILDTSVDYMMGLSDIRWPQGPELDASAQRAVSLFSALDPVKREKALAYMEGLSGK